MEKVAYEQLHFYFVKKIVIHKKRKKTKLTKKKGKRTKKRKTNEKKEKKCNKDILIMYKKVYTYNIKYHDNVSYLTTFFLFFRNIS